MVISISKAFLEYIYPAIKYSQHKDCDSFQSLNLTNDFSVNFAYNSIVFFDSLQTLQLGNKKI